MVLAADAIRRTRRQTSAAAKKRGPRGKAGPEGTWKDIASIENVPAGKYVVQGTLSAVKRGGGTLIRYQIVGPGHHTPLQAVAVGEVAGASFVNTIQLMPVNLGSSFALTLQCRRESTNEPDKATYVENVQMAAIKVGALDARY